MQTMEVKNYKKFKIECNKDNNCLKNDIIEAIDNLSIKNRKEIVCLEGEGELVFFIEIGIPSLFLSENYIYNHFKFIKDRYECSLNINSLNHESFKQELVNYLKEGWEIVYFPNALNLITIYDYYLNDKNMNLLVTALNFKRSTLVVVDGRAYNETEIQEAIRSFNKHKNSI